MHLIFDLFCETLFVWYSNEKLISIYIPISHNCCFQSMVMFTGTGHKEKKQMTFKNICFQVVETEPFRHISVVNSTLFMTSLSKVRTIVLKNQITKIYVNLQKAK